MLLGGMQAFFRGVHAFFLVVRVFLGGMPFLGGMCGFFGGVHGFFGGACMVFGGCMVFSGGACMVFFWGIRSMSGRYASYWNAFLLAVCPPKLSAQTVKRNSCGTRKGYLIDFSYCLSFFLDYSGFISMILRLIALHSEMIFSDESQILNTQVFPNKLEQLVIRRALPTYDSLNLPQFSA